MKTFQKYLTLHKGQHIIDDGLMEYGYSGVDENSKVRVIMNSINTNALNACNAAILYSPYMQEEFDIAARHLIYFIDMTPSLQNNDTTKVSSQTEVDIDGDSYYPYIL